MRGPYRQCGKLSGLVCPRCRIKVQSLLCPRCGGLMEVGSLPRIQRYRLNRRHTTDKYLPENLPLSPEVVRHRRKKTQIGDHDETDGGQV